MWRICIRGGIPPRSSVWWQNLAGSCWRILNISRCFHEEPGLKPEAEHIRNTEPERESCE
jgi:hypothetical protein